MRKRLSTVLLVAALLLLLAGCGPKEVTAEQAIAYELESSKGMQQLIEQMADGYAKYLAMTTTEAQFQASLDTYRFYYESLISADADFHRRYAVAEGADARLLAAIDDIHAARDAVGTIINSTVQGNKVIPREDILRLYAREIANMSKSLESFKKNLDEAWKQGE